jgi:hypothetical protein
LSEKTLSSVLAPVIAAVIAALVALLWLLGIVGIVVDLPGMSWWSPWLTVGPLMALVGAALISMPRQIRFLCGALGLATAGLAALYGQWAAILLGLERAVLFPAFLATIVLLRTTADQRPEIGAARRLFAAIDQDERGGGVTVGAFLLGSVLQVGVFAIFAPIVGRDAPVEERKRVFMSALRGIAIVPFWSPFIVATGVAAVYLPDVPIWQNMAVGLVIAILSILLAVTMCERGTGHSGRSANGPATVWRALATLAPVLPPIACAALIVVGASVTTSLTTLQALVIGMPIPCLLAVAAAKGGEVRAVLRATRTGIGRIGPESSMLVFAMTLGVVFEASLPAMGLLDWLKALALSPTAIIFVIIMSMNIAGLCGIHPIVSGTIALILFTGIPTGLADLVVMQAMLAGWGLCTAISIGSLSIATGAVMFGLSPEGLITRTNLTFVVVASILIVAMLSALNALLVP